MPKLRNTETYILMEMGEQVSNAKCITAPCKSKKRRFFFSFRKGRNSTD